MREMLIIGIILICIIFAIFLWGLCANNPPDNDEEQIKALEEWRRKKGRK